MADLQTKPQNTEGSEFIEKMVDTRRVTKVIKGGRVFNFSTIVVVGDGQGRIAYGQGRSKEVPLAIQKAMEKARSSLRSVALNNTTIHYPIRYKEGAVRIYIQPASEGTGVIAGGPMRAVFEAVGIQNVLAKCIGTRNAVNVVKATVHALTQMSDPQYIAEKRNKTLKEIGFIPAFSIHQGSNVPGSEVEEGGEVIVQESSPTETQDNSVKESKESKKPKEPKEPKKPKKTQEPKVVPSSDEALEVDKTDKTDKGS